MVYIIGYMYVCMFAGGVSTCLVSGRQGASSINLNLKIKLRSLTLSRGAKVLILVSISANKGLLKDECGPSKDVEHTYKSTG